MPWTVFLLFLIACAAAASTGSIFKPGTWYQELAKPSWTPPNLAFPIVWPILYVIIAWAAARVAVMPGTAHAVGFWAIQIALNTLWTPVFFGAHRMGTGAVVIGVLWVAALCTCIAFWRHDTLAGALILPYLAWLTYAFALNVAILRLN
ncbi:TspO/MBR family protein [Roseicyclus sp. F158]|uniref:TspO/MBR family protein n=1 Tax=Tropicimonas omnivorans TaxID=3075590 RepID=A0ABU3DC48_9RHOB|nr:TspO/MBR family protein [Roseicyclus sp. F158]MDT0681286.1 TspO/MBR family protein [Roseicyclus sp. F158]